MDIWAQVTLAVGTAILGAFVAAWLGYLFFARQARKQTSAERTALVESLLREIARNHAALAPTTGLEAPPSGMEDKVWQLGRVKCGEFLPAPLMLKIEYVYSNLGRVKEAFQIAIHARLLAGIQQKREKLSGVFDRELEEGADDFEMTMLQEARKGALQERQEIAEHRKKALEALKWAADWEEQLCECFNALCELEESKSLLEWAKSVQPTTSSASAINNL